MRILPINNYQKQPSHKAVNQKYLEWAKRDIAIGKNVSIDWLENIRFDTILFKELSKQDAIDTIEFVKQITNKTNTAIEHVLDCIKNSTCA